MGGQNKLNIIDKYKMILPIVVAKYCSKCQQKRLKVKNLNQNPHFISLLFIIYYMLNLHNKLQVFLAHENCATLEISPYPN